MAMAGGHGIPTNLQEFTQRIPPGWKPGMREYTFRAFLTRLTLWWRCCDVVEEAAGPLVASRLQGTAFELATKLRVVRHGTVFQGDAALALPAVAADPLTGLDADVSGLAHLLRRLVQEFQMHDQDYSTVVLDRFFDMRRGQKDLMTYCTDFGMFYEEASSVAGLELNDVGKTYLFFKWSGLSQRRIDDLKLHVDGDMSRFNELKTLVLRIAKAEQASGTRHSPEYWGDAPWDESWWTDEWDDYDPWTEQDPWSESLWQEPELENDTVPGDTEGGTEAWDETQTADDDYEEFWCDDDDEY